MGVLLLCTHGGRESERVMSAVCTERESCPVPIRGYRCYVIAAVQALGTWLQQQV